MQHRLKGAPRPAVIGASSPSLPPWQSDEEPVVPSLRGPFPEVTVGEYKCEIATMMMPGAHYLGCQPYSNNPFERCWSVLEQQSGGRRPLRSDVLWSPGGT
jgi:hypothetical protein